jgi:hypothetical protein
MMMGMKAKGSAKGKAGAKASATVKVKPAAKKPMAKGK